LAKISNKIRRNLSQDNPRLTVLLDDIFGKPVPDEALRQEIAQDIIDRILDRTERSVFIKTRGSKGSGSGKNRKPPQSAFRYSSAYISSFEFRVYGKSPNRVNLRASGDMLDSIDLIESDESKLVIGFESIDQAKKAHGHIKGTIGKIRDFFGLPETEMKRVKKEFQQDVNDLDRNPDLLGQERFPGESNLDFLSRVLALGQSNG
jgi:hypothetical protein